MSNLVPIKLADTAELIVITNINTPIKIVGVANTRIQDSRRSPWRDGYLVIYEDGGLVKKAEINQELYSALHLVFDTLNNMEISKNYLIDDGIC